LLLFKAAKIIAFGQRCELPLGYTLQKQIEAIHSISLSTHSKSKRNAGTHSLSLFQRGSFSAQMSFGYRDFPGTSISVWNFNISAQSNQDWKFN